MANKNTMNELILIMEDMTFHYVNAGKDFDFTNLTNEIKDNKGITYNYVGAIDGFPMYKKSVEKV